MSRCRDPEADADAIVFHFYRYLNDDKAFTQALAALIEELRPLIECLKNSIPEKTFRDFYLPSWPEACWLVPCTNPEAHTAIDETLSAFCQRWHLPKRHGKDDLWFSVQSGHPYLWQATRGELVPWVQERINIPPILYDPTKHDRAYLTEKIKQVQAAILAQAEHLEAQAKSAGWRPRPPRSTDEQLERIAKAIYRRVVCGWRWEQIFEEYGDACLYNLETFCKNTRKWSERCTIPL